MLSDQPVEKEMQDWDLLAIAPECTANKKKVREIALKGSWKKNHKKPEARKAIILFLTFLTTCHNLKEIILQDILKCGGRNL